MRVSLLFHGGTKTKTKKKKKKNNNNNNNGRERKEVINSSSRSSKQKRTEGWLELFHKKTERLGFECVCV